MVDIFIAYSHEDLSLKNELKKFLRPLLREERISLWDDFDIEAGEEWDAKIKERLYGAEVVVLLVSSDSLASDYFYGKEVAISLKRHKKGETIVAPIILRHCDWINTPIGELEAIPEKGRPVLEWPTKDQAWQDTVNRLRRVVEIIESKKKTEAAEAEHFRLFNAAIQTSNHLIGKGKWEEAKIALTDALGLYKKGFEPNHDTILANVNECDEAQKRQDLQQKFEMRKSLFESEYTRAESMFYQENWQEAKRFFVKILNQWEAGFAVDRNLIQQRIESCDIHLHNIIENKRHEEASKKLYNERIEELKKAFQRKNWSKTKLLADQILLDNPNDELALIIEHESKKNIQEKNGKTLNNKIIFYSVGVIFLFLLIWIIINQLQNSNRETIIVSDKKIDKDSIPEKSKDTGKIVVPKEDKQIFLQLKTIPELEKFISENPNHTSVKDAKLKIRKLKTEFDKIVGDGNLMMEKKYCKQAIDKYREALRIYPNEPTVTKIIKNSNCK